MSNEALTPLEVKELVYEWFKKLTDHDPVEDLLELLDLGSLEMRFPEATLRSEDDFVEWHKTVTHKYFDQIHEIKMLNVEIKGGMAVVRLVVNWQARTWEPPAGYSKWEGVYAHQTWEVVRKAQTGGPAISRYAVDKFDPMDGPLRIQ